MEQMVDKNKDTVHNPIPCIAGMEVKSDNGTLYYRVFNVGVSAESKESVGFITDVDYKTEWQRLE